jgi:alkylated DNA repair protein (DNA oxidative demethylase)
MTLDLFADADDGRPAQQAIAPGALLLPRFALAHECALLAALQQVLAIAPFRPMTTPGGHTMSVQLSSCGLLGWVSDEHGYRYSRRDPLTQQPWPALPPPFLELAQAAAAAAGFNTFMPDACLINRYEPGARMSLHQDRNERDFSQPIVSVSLGLPAVFEFGGLQRSDKTLRFPLAHGDVVVWGGPSRLRFHGVQPVKAGDHPLLGAQRINLTFRKAS